MKIIFQYIVFLTFFSLASYGQSKVNIQTNPDGIIYSNNVYADFTKKELVMLQQVYGSSLKTEILDRPTRVLAVKEIFRNRVVVEQVLDPKKQKPCPLLSEVPLFNVFVTDIQVDAIFKPSSFNPLKYDFSFHAPGIQRFRVDNTNYFITIKSQYYNTKL